MADAFELTAEERSCAGISFDGQVITVRPTPKARRQIVWSGLTAVVLGVLFVFPWLASGVWFVGAFFAPVFVFYGLMTWRMAVARLVIDTDGLVVRNMWSTSRIAAAEVASITFEQQPESSLWTYGMDFRWPPTWGPVIVGAIMTWNGRRVLPEALRSEDVGPSSEALIKLGLLGRWRTTFWLKQKAEDH